MAAQPDGNTALTHRLALEALRNGVPNREAVRILGCSQPQAKTRFDEILTKAMDIDNPPTNSLGMLVSGDFGTGKSHLLTYLEHEALSKDFVCSRVAISKETPLHNLGKVFKSAVEGGRIPNRSGRLIEELGQALKPDSKEYVTFFEWANNAASSGLLSQMFPASLLVHERSGDLELDGEIESFWAGDRLKISRVKEGLRQVGQQQSYSFRAPKATELPPQRLRFAIELIKGAGYKGWVVLLDEVELVGYYSLLQRGRSYAELTRWMGQAANETYPGLVVVGTVTDDFEPKILGTYGKNDRDYVVPRLRVRNDDAVAARAETGMRLLEQECMPLNPPTDTEVREMVEKLRQIYSDAYGWPAPALPGETRGAGYQNRMRYKVRAAINEWDLLRLYPDSQPEIVSDEFHHTYEENVDLERESKDNAGDAE